MKLSIGLLSILLSTASFAEGACKVKVSFNFWGSETLKAQLEQSARNSLAGSNFELVESGAQMDVEFSSRASIDPHSGKRFPIVEIEIHPSNKPKYLSKFGEAFWGRARFYSRLQFKHFNALLSQATHKYLKDCKTLDDQSHADGSGTLNLQVGEKFTTSTGAIFERVERTGFGSAWKAPNGTIWSETLEGKFQNLDLDGTQSINGIIQKSAATEACKAIGGRLPTAEDFKQLVSYFEFDAEKNQLTKKGAYQFQGVFPWSKYLFWTSSSVSAQMAHDFFHPTGIISANASGQRNWDLPVRCIAN